MNKQQEKRLNEIIDQYNGVLFYLGQNANDQKICNVTQVQIAEYIGITPSLVSNRMKRLIELGCIDRGSTPGQYLVLKNTIKGTLLGKLKEISKYMIDKPGISDRAVINQFNLKPNEFVKIKGHLIYVISE